MRDAGTSMWYVLVVVWYLSISRLYYIYHARERKHKHDSENAPCEVVSCANNSNVPKRRKCTMNRLGRHRLIGSSP
jgi:hypothetical protein